MGMTIALLISGYEQSQIERAIEGSTWLGYFKAQIHPWFVEGLWWRQVMGYVTTLGLVLLIWDLLTIGKKEAKNI